MSLNADLDRPIEPYSISENPERWAEIADWEANRANVAQAELYRMTVLTEESITRALDQFFESPNGCKWMIPIDWFPYCVRSVVSALAKRIIP